VSRRGSRKASRGRRTPQKAQRRGAPEIPWVPLMAVVAVVAVIAVIVFVVLQSGGSSGDEDAAIAAEANKSSTLPGQYVDLPAIYGGAYPETAGHVSQQVDYGAQDVDPPVGGPHWSGGGCDDPASAAAFCGPAPWGIFRDPYEPETLVHNMEHGGVIVWYNTADTALRDELEAIVEARLEDDDLIVMAPYPDMEADTIALTSWTRIDKFPVSEFTAERVTAFIDAHQRRFNPEHF